ncbi:hypothetical protein Ssi03_18610 [Sphaerisporangium siamense]|uniref:Alpha/beta hydrolase domain-containing protein n=1 Tax=Sphaerisporangium siamense TaxID=795645 RepID=A0A7W7DFH8_9ACTN|nr:alpha/beta hydrolase domain-containing protein [Sphaerisporangium siamense]MBB4705065.1 hypothetical protein [Sphaerisporangium siamense]GII83871.1 hypothetical protein Ssi03_18610 [Sphaerisporangium siamense]
MIHDARHSSMGIPALYRVPSHSGRGRAFEASGIDVATLGYAEEEFLLKGTAFSYRDTTTARSHGGTGPGAVTVHAQAPYVTRILVRTPARRERFAGTVVVEWLNVADFVDAGVEWTYTYPELVRRGMAWVGVSAQCAGVIGGPRPVQGPAPGGLKAWDLERYGRLEHPGDDWSYDMYSQAGRVVRDMFPGARLIGAGVSQAAYRLTTYINKIDPLDRIYDGFLAHSRVGAAAPLALPDRPERTDWRPVPFRDDLRVPVLALQTETDVVTLGYMAARQPDGERFRLWEVAGAAHVDTYNDAATSGAVTSAVLAAGTLPGLTSGAFPGHAPDTLPGHTAEARPGHTPGNVPGHTSGAFRGHTPETLPGRMPEPLPGRTSDARFGLASGAFPGPAAGASSGRTGSSRGLTRRSSPDLAAGFAAGPGAGAAAMAAALAPRTRACGLDFPYLVNSAPQHHYVAKAALYHLDRWIRDDIPPPHAPRLATVSGSPPALVRDAYGNTLGGIRTPWMDAPTAVLTGISPDDGLLERLFGLTVPFSKEILATLYADDAAYRTAFTQATDTAVREGFLLDSDAPLIKSWPSPPR